MKFNSFVGVSNNVKTVAKMSLVVVVLFYFIYHAISGENGFLSYIRTKKLVIERQSVLENLHQEFKSLERAVNLLSSDKLDLDLLDERCRAMLNFSEATDYIVLNLLEQDQDS